MAALTDTRTLPDFAPMWCFKFNRADVAQRYDRDLRGAILTFERALKIRESVFGRGHPDNAWVVGQLQACKAKRPRAPLASDDRGMDGEVAMELSRDPVKFLSAGMGLAAE